MADHKKLIPLSRISRFLAALVVVVGTLTSAGCGGGEAGGTQRIEINGEVFTLELAMTDATRLQGLSDRDSIPADGGMLFVFPSEKPRAFVMRRCLVPIDIIFLSPGGKVLATHAMQIEPADRPEDELKRYASGGKTAFVIELAAGSLERLGLEVGDPLELPLLELKRRAR